MKTLYAIAGLAVLSLAFAGSALAQSPSSPNGPNPDCESGDCIGLYEHRWQRTEEKQAQNAWQEKRGGQALLDGYMHTELALALGLSPESLQARNDNGETFWQIAESQGYSFEEAQALMNQAREAAMQKAMADGAVSNFQAQHMFAGSGSMNGQGSGPGMGDCSGDGPLGGSNAHQNQGGGRGR